MAAIITFKVDVDMATGIPTKNLLPECINYFKTQLKLDIKTSDEIFFIKPVLVLK